MRSRGWTLENGSSDDARPSRARDRLAGPAATPPLAGVPVSELLALPLLLQELDPRAMIWIGEAVATPAGGGKATGHP